MTMIRSLSASASSRYCVVSSVAMPACLEVAHQVPDTLSATRIQPGGGLVEKRHFGTHHQTAGDVDPSTHPTGVRAHQPIRGIDQVELGREVPRPATRAAFFLSPCSRPNISRFSRPVSMSSKATCWPVSMIDRRTPAGSDTTSWPATSASAAIRPGQRRQDVHHRRLAGTVRARASRSPHRGPTSKLMSRSATTESERFSDPV